MSEASDRPSPLRRFAAGLLIAMGALMMILCGGCGVVFALTSLREAMDHPAELSWLILPAVFGGLPAWLGFRMIKAGWPVLRAPSGLGDGG